MGCSAELQTWLCRASKQIEAFECLGQYPGSDCPGQQVATDRETIPKHAQDCLRVFLEILEHQTVQALVEFTVEIQLSQG